MGVYAGDGLHAGDQGLAGEVALQLLNVLGEALCCVGVAAQCAAQGVHVCARRAAQAEIDAVGVELGQGAELLGHDVGGVVG